MLAVGEKAVFDKINNCLINVDDLKIMSSREVSKYYMKLYFEFIELLEKFEHGCKDIDCQFYLTTAKNLLLFSRENNFLIFRGINEEKTLIMVAVIYYILGYNFECHLVLENINIESETNEYVKSIIYLLKNKYYDNWILKEVKNYFISKEYTMNELYHQLYEYEKKCVIDDQCYIQILIALISNIKNNSFFELIMTASQIDINEWKEFTKLCVKKNEIVFLLPRYFNRIIQDGLLNNNMIYLEIPSNYTKYNIWC